MTANGLQRVIVEHVTPEIDAGRFYIKKVAGEILTVEADIFADGHDHVRGRLLCKHDTEKEWQHYEMHLINNDRWITSCTLPKTGFYNYTVIGWVDHTLTWHHGFLKKYEDAQQMGVELLIGANLLGEMLPKATAADKKLITQIITTLRNAKKYDAAISGHKQIKFSYGL